MENTNIGENIKEKLGPKKAHKKLSRFLRKLLLPFLTVILILALTAGGAFGYWQFTQLQSNKQQMNQQLDAAKQGYEALQQEFDAFKTTDQVQRNDVLEKEIADLLKVFKDSLGTYEELLDLKLESKKTKELEEEWSTVLSQLSLRNYASASATLVSLNNEVKEMQKTVASSAVAAISPANVPVNNTPPASGYSRQTVQTEIGQFVVDIISADLSSTKVVVDTASEGTCTNDCPVASLASFAGRSGAYAGINGPYFCPAAYPSCAGKTNSFDTLLMNKNKVYFNSENNVYSTVPAAIFSTTARFVGQSLEWGRGFCYRSSASLSF